MSLHSQRPGLLNNIHLNSTVLCCRSKQNSSRISFRKRRRNIKTKTLLHIQKRQDSWPKQKQSKFFVKSTGSKYYLSVGCYPHGRVKLTNQCKVSKFYQCSYVYRALDSKSEGLGFDSQCWSCVEVFSKLHIPHCLRPLCHGSIVAGCIGVRLARGKVKCEEHM